MTEKDKVLVIIVTYNWEKRANNVVKCLNNSHHQVDTIIIDNWSTDSTIKIYKKNLTCNHIIIENKKNLWFWLANNIWFEYAINNNYDFVYLLNQDAWFFEDTIETLINICKKYNIWILSPFHCSSELDKIDSNFQEWVCSLQANKNIFSDIYFNRRNEIYEIPWVMAAHRFIPISTIKKVWWFSPTFFHYWKDVNYIDRVKFFGKKIYVTPNLIVVHDRYNREDSNNKKIYFWYTSCLRLLSNPNEKSIIKTIFIWLALNIYNIFKYQSLKPIAYIFKILKNYPTIIKNKKTSINWTEHPFLKIKK